MFRTILGCTTALLACTGCMSAGQHRADVRDDATDRLTAGTVQREIRVGMPGAEVIQALGSPNVVTTDEGRREVWVYDKVATERALQTRRFDGVSEGRLLAAGAAVLQDLGFTIDEAETRLGLIVASKERSAVNEVERAADDQQRSHQRAPASLFRPGAGRRLDCGRLGFGDGHRSRQFVRFDLPADDLWRERFGLDEQAVADARQGLDQARFARGRSALP